MPDDKVIFHVVFALRNSRYLADRFKRRKKAVYISGTAPFIEGKEEEQLLEIMCSVALDLYLNIITFNFCGDHVHALVHIARQTLKKYIGLWKGKVAYHLIRKMTERSNNVK